MESIAISDIQLDFFEIKLNQLLVNNNSFLAMSNVNLLKNKIAECKRDGTLNYPALRPQIPDIIKCFLPLSKEIALEIANGAKVLCKGCMFHNESCLINFLFIIFKSVELQKEVPFKDIKPNVRMVY